MISSAMLLAGLAVADANRQNCFMSGDPHVRGFDQTRGWSFHPVFAPGAWWLVHTESGEFQAQATYAQCGRRTGGGWQGWKKHQNTSAHCLQSIAFGGSLLENKGLVIQPPCEWNWGDMKCDSCTADKMPRVTFNGRRVDLTSNTLIEVAPKLNVKCRANRCEVMVDGKRVELVLSFHGGAGFEPTRTKTCTAGVYGSMNLWMKQGDFGKQCGHCGNFDGNAGNDNIYDGKGLIKTGVQSSAMCEASVNDCHQMFQEAHIPTQYNSNGDIIPADETLCGCNEEDNKCKQDDSRNDVATLCANAYKKVCSKDASPTDDLHKPFYEECVEDVCLGGTAFTEIDVVEEGAADCTETESMNDDAVCKHCK